MSSSSKTLTVSYGTFSCTLEGFEDSFGTMKAIAEYFRELTAEHPYFGAIPPTPDADRLQAIAERETRRRIDARVSDGGVVLRQAPPPRPEPAQRPQNGGNGETIAERLARLRALVARSREAAGPAPASIFDEDDHGEGDEAADDGADVPSILVSEPADDIVGAEAFAAAEAGGGTDAPEAAAAEAEAGSACEPPTAPEAAETAPPPEDDAAMQPQDRPDDDADARAPRGAAGPSPEPAFPPERAAEEPAALEPPAPHAPAPHGSARPGAGLIFGARLGKIGPRPHPAARPAEPAGDRVGDKLRSLLGGAASEEPPAAAAPSAGAAGDEAPETGDSSQRPRDVRPFPGDAAGGPDEDYVARIAETAASQFAESENRRRLASLSHLKAAVAATVADRALGAQGAEAEPASELDRYRDDLSRLVPGGRGPERESGPRPQAQPLVLVSSQRVDPSAEEEEALPAPIRNVVSRLEDAAAAATAQGASSFAAFARTVGAATLPDLLEAAGAYLALHEGQEHFSRPQIMRKIAQVTSEDDFSREEGLRSFGALLRTGRLQKVRRGQFTISKNSRFRLGAGDRGR